MTLLRTEISANDEVLRRLAHVLPPRTRTLVIGGYGCGNVGDEAILSVMLDDLRSLRARPRVVSVNAGETTQMHDVRAYPASLVNVGRALFEADALVIGGGGIFSRYMGPRSRQLPPLARIAKALGRRVVFRALGVYASTPPDVARALVGAMRHADFISVRDEASVEALRSFGLRRDLVVEDDPALRLPISTGTAARSGCTVGLALRRVRDPEEQRHLEREFLAVIDGLVDRGVAPLLLPFSRHPSEPIEQDDAYAQDLRRRSRSPGRCSIAPADLTPLGMLDLVRSLDGVVAMRFHAIVFASLAGVPAVAIPYDDKCSEFLAEHRMSSVETSALTAQALLAALPVAVSSAAA